ncbi:CYTH-like domain-containing protein [Thamnocephalis sphaerospora]|uniref:mRNA-capping enzyme subunit beta n=1 Tax=Thamnocephalis sphaerospora TaxID=78915 RepID=A0A4V1IXC3_9FUNG|nr:CYTH-like domain-containing protein [Thamnocephalis sphaerospora]|eukprot:RKP10559.1 CYTH-like domain-containing protein [Thamnocephalis sphaerospora]
MADLPPSTQSALAVPPVAAKVTAVAEQADLKENPRKRVRTDSDDNGESDEGNRTNGATVVAAAQGSVVPTLAPLSAAPGAGGAAPPASSFPPLSASQASVPTLGAVQMQSHALTHSITAFSAASGLEPTLFGNCNVDDALRIVTDLILRYINQSNLEIEAKFGLLLDKQTGQRIRLPVVSETVISPSDASWMRFESNMPAEWHKRINERLNKRVEETQKPNHKGHRVGFKRVLERDRFYQEDGVRTRVTFDWDGNNIVPGGIMWKERLADLNMHLPMCPFDFRISINTEEPASMPSSQWTHERKKNRATYKHQHCKVDLTLVTSQDVANTTHELELELWDVAALKREHGRHLRKERNSFAELVRVFLDNARVLARLP